MRSVSMPIERDYYEILQVSPEAEDEVISAAYRRLARKYHPDVSSDAGAHSRMRELNAAIEVLGDPNKRAAYDAVRLGLRPRGRAEPAWGSQRPKLFPEPRAGDPEALNRRSPVVLPVILGAGVVFLGLAAAVAIRLALGAGDSPEPNSGASREGSPLATSPAPAVAEASSTPEPPAAPGSATLSSGGTWLVNQQIAPGIWRAFRPEECAWKRLASTDTSDVVGSGSQLTVEIQPSDAAFWSEGCGWWIQVLTAPSAGPTQPFGAGTWLVPDEVAPGLWQNSDSSAGCSWARLGRLDGGPGAVTASGSTDSSTIAIMIARGDRAFHSIGCGTWTRVGE